MGPDGGNVRPGVRLGDAYCPDQFALEGRFEPFVDLFFGSELENRGRGHVGLDGEDHGDGLAHPSHFLEKDHLSPVVATLAAGRLGKGETEKPELSGPPEHVVGEVAPGLPFGEMWGDLRIDPLAHRLPEEIVLFGERRQLHRVSDINFRPDVCS